MSLKNPWKDWHQIYIMVGNGSFHIYNLLPQNTPNPEIRKLTAVLQSLEHRGVLRKVGHVKIPKVTNRGHKVINQYAFVNPKVR